MSDKAELERRLLEAADDDKFWQDALKSGSCRISEVMAAIEELAIVAHDLADAIREQEDGDE